MERDEKQYYGRPFDEVGWAKTLSLNQTTNRHLPRPTRTVCMAAVAIALGNTILLLQKEYV